MSSVQAGEFKLEVVVLPVSDVDRAKEFYASLGWRLDADVTARWGLASGPVHAAGLRVLHSIWHERHVCRARFGRERLPERLRYRGGA